MTLSVALFRLVFWLLKTNLFSSCPIISKYIFNLNEHVSIFLLLVCTEKLGVENGDIPHENFDASHDDISFPAYKARLNGASVWSSPAGPVDGRVDEPWIQVDIGYTTNVSGLLTQGDGGTDAQATPDWITKLKVSTSSTSVDDPQVFIKDGNGAVKVGPHIIILKMLVDVS